MYDTLDKNITYFHDSTCYETSRTLLLLGISRDEEVRARAAFDSSSQLERLPTLAFKSGGAADVDNRHFPLLDLQVSLLLQKPVSGQNTSTDWFVGYGIDDLDEEVNPIMRTVSKSGVSEWTSKTT
jgi:hypothetical protein